MKTLLILRHAKSSWKSSNLADHERPLNKRGKQTAPLMGEFLAQRKLLPDLIISSTAKRARSTTKRFIAASQYQGPVIYAKELYLTTPAQHIEVLSAHAQKEDCVMLVGHNPGLEELLVQLTAVEENLPTAAVAQISVSVENWQDLTMATASELVALWRPRQLFEIS